MKRCYVISRAGVTLAGARTLAWINPGTTCSIRLRRLWVAQSANATSAQQRVQAVRQVSAFPTLTSITPAKLDELSPTSQIVGGTTGAAGTCGYNASAEGAGAKSILFEDAFNVLNGWVWIPTRDEEVVLGASSASGFGLYFPVAPATLTDWAFGLVFEEC